MDGRTERHKDRHDEADSRFSKFRERAEMTLKCAIRRRKRVGNCGMYSPHPA